VFVTFVQLAVRKSEFCCNTKFVEGTIHHKVRLPFDLVMVNPGAGVVCDVQIAPLPKLAVAATSLLPSAEEATDTHSCHSEPSGTPFEIQVVPELVVE